MKEQISKSPDAGFVVRIITDLTKEEVVANIKAMDAAIQTGQAASDAKARWAAAIKG